MIITRRRCLLAMLGTPAALWPLAAPAQPAERMRQIGVLANALSEAQWQNHLAAFTKAMADLGWTEGRNLRIAAHLFPPATSPDGFRRTAHDMVSMRPDLIVARSSSSALAVLEESRTIPVVAVGIGDPVELGIAASAAHPGGNLTGFTNLPQSVVAKFAELLHELAPGVRRLLVPFNPANATSSSWKRAVLTAFATTGVEIVTADITRTDEVEPLVAAFAAGAQGGLIVPPQATGILRSGNIVALAARYRLPAIYITRDFVEAGGLVSYSIDTVEEFRKAAAYADRILRGELAADLPIQSPSRFELVLNARTATSLGLTIPRSLLARADEVIE